MDIKACRPYHGVDAGRRLVRMAADSRSAFKIYYVSIVGRDQPERYEWERSGFACDAFERIFAASAFRGIGFVTAFPHITKVFVFAPAMETVLHVRAMETRTLTPMSLDRGDGWTEMACFAEAGIAADEYAFWASAPSVDGYLSAWSRQRDWPIVSNTKLGAYFQNPGGQKTQ